MNRLNLSKSLTAYTLQSRGLRAARRGSLYKYSTIFCTFVFCRWAVLLKKVVCFWLGIKNTTAVILICLPLIKLLKAILAFAWFSFGASHPNTPPFSILHLLHNLQIPNQLERPWAKRGLRTQFLVIPCLMEDGRHIYTLGTTEISKKEVAVHLPI